MITHDRFASRSNAPARPPHPRARRRDGHDDPAPRLDEADFRGDALRRPPARPQGQQRPARRSRGPTSSRTSTARSSRPAPTSSRPTRSPPPPSRSPTTGSRRSSTISTSPAARLARGAPTSGRRDAGPAALRRRLDRPDHRTRRCRPTSTTRRRAVTFDELVDAYGEQARGLIDGGVDLLLTRDPLRHAQRQGRALRVRRARSSETRRAAAGDRLGDDHRPVRPHALGPDGRGVLRLDRARRPFAVSINCALGADDMRPVRRRAGAASPTSASACYPNAGLPNEFGEYDDTPEHMAGSSASSPRGPAQLRRRLLRHDARAHRGDRARGRAGVAPRTTAPHARRAHPARGPRAADHHARDQLRR